MSDLDRRLDAIFAARNREDMGPTIDAFRAVEAEHPDDPRVLYEVGGAYDTGGQEATAVDYYARALEAGLSGDLRRRCLLQYASSLRNLERAPEAEAMLTAARAEFPDSPSLAVFHALALQSLGRSEEALALALVTLADHTDSEEIRRYGPAIRGYAAELGQKP